ncbi:serine/threonine protein kinase [Parafrankia irregularis]|uniref:non-specific serine/threonine protein kinase n=1 Tax=Parafrankia irregularis TaxID=795642 RepID=A0A0S4QQW6_9ACTN|nr:MULTISPECIES: serine/threonine-protein kinase [Parafrankia]MBE3200574.1 protein kinase [Parafrankia sp. CH37]CUU56906.1 serine/threonine protein kinase [Parafrankia irregularis]
MALLSVGQVIRDTYTVERLLGRGAFAEVYRVEHRYLGRQAMKVFRQEGMSAEQVRDALGEAMLLSRMGHPNIVRVFEANTVEADSGGHAYFTMEYVNGGTLTGFRQSFGDAFVPIPVAVDVMRQVARGLAVAHRESPPIVHRDITPQNILVGYDRDGPRARISDFGLARKVSALTLLASSQGTIAFMAPETLLHPHLASMPGDVWALGAVFYLLLTDEFPYPRRAAGDPITAAWDTTALVPPNQVRYAVDDLLNAIIVRALSFDTATRYPSAAEMLADLEAWPARQNPPRQDGPPRHVPPKDPPPADTGPTDSGPTGTGRDSRHADTPRADRPRQRGREPGPAGEIAAGKNTGG